METRKIILHLEYIAGIIIAPPTPINYTHNSQMNDKNKLSIQWLLIYYIYIQTKVMYNLFLLIKLLWIGTNFCFLVSTRGGQGD